MNCYFHSYIDTEVKKVTPEEIQFLESIIESIYIFAFTWSICCTVDDIGRHKLDSHIKTLMD